MLEGSESLEMGFKVYRHPARSNDFLLPTDLGLELSATSPAMLRAMLIMD